MSCARCARLAVLVSMFCVVAPILAQAPDCSGISGVLPSNANLAGELTTILVASGLTRPTFVTAAPGDLDRMFIVEQAGRIEILKNGTVLETPFLDINLLVRDTGNEEGLLSLAFHPDYENNGLFFVFYTDNLGDQIVARYAVSSDPEVADAISAQIVLTIPHPTFGNHNGGQVAFSPLDGHLYVSVGDGGSGCDPGPGIGNGQNTETLLGKILRLNVSVGPMANYTTDDNPFDDAFPGRDEIWAYGLRNPYRVSFDRVSGSMFIGDVGQNNWEEIDCAPGTSTGGENYGWVNYEGNHCANPSCGSATCDIANYVKPVKEYSLAGVPCAIIGGYVYRGCRMEEMRGHYFYGDHCDDNRLTSFRVDDECSLVGHPIPRAADLQPTTGFLNDLTSFGEDNRGELYLVDRSGEVWKIEPELSIMETSGQGGLPFLLGRDTWSFEDLAATTAHAITSYRVYGSSDPAGPFTCQTEVTDCADGACTTVNLQPDPQANEVLYYLLTAVALDGSSTSPGQGSDGTPRALSILVPCPGS